MESKPFAGKTISTIAFYDEDLSFVYYHVERMGGRISTGYEGSVDCLIHYKDIENDELESTKRSYSNSGQIELISFDEFQKIALDTIIDDLYGSRTVIKDKEFLGFCEIEEIYIPETVTEIGEYAFYGCDSLKEIHLPKGLVHIGKGAFMGCCSLKRLEIPAGVKEIPDDAFNLYQVTKRKGDSIRFTTKVCRLESLVLPTCLKTIGNESFAGLHALQELIIPVGVEEIGFRAFEDSGLKNVSLPPTVKAIGDNAFSGVKEISVYDNLEGNIGSLGRRMFGGLEFGFTVTVLSKDTGDIKAVVPMFSDGDIKLFQCLRDAWVNNKAEFDFDKLDSYFRKIKQPETKRKIAEHRLNNPPEPSEESLKMYSSYLKRTASRGAAPIDNKMFETKGKTLVKYLGDESCSEVIIPEGITAIGCDPCFKNASSIRKIIFPEGFTTFEKSTGGVSFVFSACMNLVELILPDTLMNMPYGALDFIKDEGSLKYNKYDNGLYLGNEKNPYVCLVKTISKDIQSIIVPDGCRVICGYAFEDCLSLESIILPDSIIMIEDEKQHMMYGETRKNIYLRRTLKMNLPKGYLRRAEKLPGTFTYDLLTTKWRDEATIEDYAWLYVFQASKNLDEISEKKMKADPNRAAAEMSEALIKNPKKAGFKKAAGFIVKNKEKIEKPIVTAVYEGAVSAKAKDAADLLEAISGRSDIIEIPSVVAESKYINVDRSTLEIAEGVTIIPKGFLDTYCKHGIRKIILPDSVRLFDESKLPKDIRVNMPEGYARSKEKMPAKFTCDLLSRQWRKHLTVTDYAYLYLYQGGTNFKELCLPELKWDPDTSCKELIKALKDGGKNSHYFKAAEFIEENQVYISNEALNAFLDAARNVKAKKAISTVEPSLKKRKKDVWANRKDIEVFCHDNFSDYANECILRDAYIYNVTEVKYKNSVDIAPMFVVKCAIAPYVELFKSFKEGVKLELLPKADKIASELDKQSFIEAMADIAQSGYWWHSQSVIPVCRFADEITVSKIIDQIRYANVYRSNSDYKKGAAVASEALLLNDTDASKKFAQSIGRMKDYEKIHK